MPPTQPKRADPNAKDRSGPSTRSGPTPLRVLISAAGQTEQALRAAVDTFDRLTCELTFTTAAAGMGMEVLRETHDVFVMDARDDLGAVSTTFPDDDAAASRALIVLVDETSAGWTLPAGAVQLPVRSLTGPLLESIIELSVGRASYARQLDRARKRYELAALSANDGFWCWDLRSGACSFSNRWRSLLGVADNPTTQTLDTWLDRVHPEDIEGLHANLDAHVNGAAPTHEFEHRVRHRNGRWRWVVTRGVVHRDAVGMPLEMSGTLTDITRRKSSETMLQTDATTGLASRMSLMESLGEAIENHRKAPHPDYVLLFLNVDGFKVVNESIGLESADRILSQLGERLLGSVASNHLVCRYGGDEFAILMRGGTDISDAQRVSAVIRDGLNRPFVVDGQEVFTSVSSAITSSALSYERPSEVLRDVGIALTEAKRRHRGGCVVFETEMRQHARGTLRLQTELRQAMDRDEFEVFYQPIVNLKTSVISGFEALIRWQHPRRGVVFPDEFIPLAEETGLIVPIGLNTLRRACAQLAAWLAAYPSPEPLSLSVNLSSVQVTSPSLVDDVAQVLADTGLAAAHLKLEITESMLFEDTEGARKVLSRLRALGVQLFIDDFGTGYSSLTYLHEFPATGLKIDKSFVDMLGKTERPGAIVPTIISLAHTLSLDVVAEGVETTEQRDLLRSLSCKEAQGFLFSPALDAEEATAAVAARHQQYTATAPQTSADAIADGPGSRYRRR